MNALLLYALAVFAVYRLSLMIGIEDGPFNLFHNLREKVFDRFGNGWINDGFNCPLCISFWLMLGAAIVLAWQLRLGIDELLWLWLGLAGMVAFLLLVSRSAK